MDDDEFCEGRPFYDNVHRTTVLFRLLIGQEFPVKPRSEGESCLVGCMVVWLVGGLNQRRPALE
ncbi:hypothetical protein J6590_068503 [Homalodisca vitripennis]|nr:hypothetical protein J6590_068503 [Homalodisca vitripennis]